MHVQGVFFFLHVRFCSTRALRVHARSHRVMHFVRAVTVSVSQGA